MRALLHHASSLQHHDLVKQGSRVREVMRYQEKCHVMCVDKGEETGKDVRRFDGVHLAHGFIEEDKLDKEEEAMEMKTRRGGRGYKKEGREKEEEVKGREKKRWI